MTSKSPARICDDVDEQVLSYAEIKAICAGNPLIKEKIDLETEIGKLKMLKTEHRNLQYRMQDNLLTQMPKRIKATEETILALHSDIETINKHTYMPEKDFLAAVHCGTRNKERKNAVVARENQ